MRTFEYKNEYGLPCIDLQKMEDDLTDKKNDKIPITNIHTFTDLYVIIKETEILPRDLLLMIYKYLYFDINQFVRKESGEQFFKLQTFFNLAQSELMLNYFELYPDIQIKECNYCALSHSISYNCVYTCLACKTIISSSYSKHQHFMECSSLSLTYCAQCKNPYISISSGEFDSTSCFITNHGKLDSVKFEYTLCLVCENYTIDFINHTEEHCKKLKYEVIFKLERLD